MEVQHPEKDSRPPKKAKKSTEGQSTLDNFVGQIEVPFKVSVIIHCLVDQI